MKNSFNKISLVLKATQKLIKKTDVFLNIKKSINILELNTFITKTTLYLKNYIFHNILKKLVLSIKKNKDCEYSMKNKM